MIAPKHRLVLLLGILAFVGVMRMLSSHLISSSPKITGLITTAIAIAVVLLASNFIIVYAQQVQSSQPLAIENGTASTKTFQSKNDSFGLQVPDGWAIQDVNNTGFTLGVEALQGYGILAQLCPEEEHPQQQAALPNASGSSSSSSSKSNNSCRGAQEEVIHIVRFPNLGAKLGFDSEDVITREDIPADAILAYQIQRLQEVGYRDVGIVNNTDTTISLISTALNNSAIGTVPAKLVEMTYSTTFAPTEIRRGYLISTATDATPRNLGMITGYAIFYEGGGPVSAAEMATATSDSLRPLPPAVGQIFDSFELMAAPEVEQAIFASLSAQTEEEEVTANSLMAEIISNDTEGVAPATFEFEADITGGTEPYTIRWDFDNDGSVESDEETVSATFNEAGTYNVNLAVTDSQGQTSSDSIEITIDEAPAEELPAVEEPATEETEETSCDPSYPDMCIPPPPPTLTCDDIGTRNFEVLPPDPHGFDGDNDGIGCESGSSPPDVDEPNNSGSEDSLNFGGLINRIIDGAI